MPGILANRRKAGRISLAGPSSLPVFAKRRGKANQRQELGPVAERVSSTGGSSDLRDLVVAEFRRRILVAQFLAEGCDRHRKTLIRARLIERFHFVRGSDRGFDQLGNILARQLVAYLHEGIFV